MPQQRVQQQRTERWPHILADAGEPIGRHILGGKAHACVCYTPGCAAMVKV